MEKQIFTKKLFYKYVISRNTSINNHNGFYIQERNKFFVSVNSIYYGEIKKSFINRNFEIVAEDSKMINKQKRNIRFYFFIDTHNIYGRTSAKALFRKYQLIPRKKRVLEENFFKTQYENESRN